ncbi:MAG: phosphoenolpyruvate--protein phosphotransferase [Rhodothermia bacterium]|nr:MAG: phosphoenolpyruvate--protein phosphotransferase [Rhodothermia bacterium]
MLRGEIISPGVVEGILHLLTQAAFVPPRRATVLPGEEKNEVERFRQHVDSLVEDFQATVKRLESASLSAEAEIVRSHILILQDPELHSRVETSILQAQLAAEAAVEHALEEIIYLFEESENAVLSERAPDLRDLGMHLQRKLGYNQAPPLSSLPADDSGIVVANVELLPSFVLEALAADVRGFIVEKGTALSHAAILAKSFGLPVLRIPRVDLLRRHEGTRVLVDARQGELLIDPDPEEVTHRTTKLRTLRDQALSSRLSPTVARLWLSIVDPMQLKDVDWTGIEGVGLYRTEMLFIHDHQRWPSEEEQTRLYRKAFEYGGTRLITIRTLDIGADKPLPYLSFGPQDNPALGLRAHRLYRFHPEIAITQIRAILRAASGTHRLRLLFPMLECVEEWHAVQELVHQATASLRVDGIPFQEQFEQGVLIETPSAVWDFPRFLNVVDFASVGTNDLVQYLFAVDRNNANVARAYRPAHPVVLKVLRELADQARQAGKPLSVCGEIAGEAWFIPLLIGLGITDLSVPVPRSQETLIQLAQLQASECRELAQKCLIADTVSEVRTRLGRQDPATQVKESGSERPGEAVDPVCKMTVHTVGNPLAVTQGDMRYYFCSSRCMDLFLHR